MSPIGRDALEPRDGSAGRGRAATIVTPAYHGVPPVRYSRSTGTLVDGTVVRASCRVRYTGTAYSTAAAELHTGSTLREAGPLLPRAVYFPWME